MKFNFAAIALFVIAVSGHSQTLVAQTKPCSLKVAQSPTVRGIKLGMRLEEVLALFPGSRENEQVKMAISNSEASPRFGVINLFIAPGQYSPQERFLDLDFIQFVLVDGRVVEYSVQYGGPPWPKPDEFVDKVAGAFNLPPAETWFTDQQSRTLPCDGFSVRASTQNFRGSLLVKTSDNPSAIRNERRAASEAQARRDFRP